MIDYAFIDLHGAALGDASDRAARALAVSYPECSVEIVDRGCTSNGQRWFVAHFDLDGTTGAGDCVRTYASELHRRGVSFWRVVPPIGAPNAANDGAGSLAMSA